MSGFPRPRWPRLSEVGGRLDWTRLRYLGSRLFGEAGTVARSPGDLPNPKVFPPGQRVYAVGDIHGRVDLLSRMLDLIRTHEAKAPSAASTMVFLGDYVDRGPSSREVIDRLLAFGKEHRSVFLMGNHEEALLRFLVDPRDGLQWFRLGGLQTLASYGIDIDALHFGVGPEGVRTAFLAALPDAHREFFLTLELSRSIGEFFFCHAGVRPGVELGTQAPHDLIWIREEFLTWRGDFGMMVVHGHTPVAEPELLPNRVNVDTGAFATGRLTCAVIEGSEIRFLST
ncbi:MAG: serine/threonine protein phosphatase [Hyphomicrobiales bacterium]|nr:serine/threonine protein phosphatase [Hyphomicrobiales bacterium]